MKKTIFAITICFFVICSLLLVGCDKLFNPNIELTIEQQQVYDEIETYAISCNSSNEKEELLYQIKWDIKKASNDKLGIELSIGKLKIDKLILKYKFLADIADKERIAANNKIKYKDQRDSISNIYQGTEASYKAELSICENKISEAYSDYLMECNKINSSHMGSGYKQIYKDNAYQNYLNEYSTYSSKMSQLNTQWKNKLNYDKYNRLYNEVDSTLEKDIQSLESKYQSDCAKIETQINNLIKQR